jgi:hypothetical protein
MPAERVETLVMPEDASARMALPDPLCVVETVRHLDIGANDVGTVVWATG